jgi:hypothetical protein
MDNDTSIPTGETRSVSWLRSHGWEQDDRRIWIDRIWLNMTLAQQYAVAKARAFRAAEGLRQRPPARVFGA